MYLAEVQLFQNWKMTPSSVWGMVFCLFVLNPNPPPPVPSLPLPPVDYFAVEGSVSPEESRGTV